MEMRKQFCIPNKLMVRPIYYNNPQMTDKSEVKKKSNYIAYIIKYIKKSKIKFFLCRLISIYDN